LTRFYSHDESATLRYMSLFGDLNDLFGEMKEIGQELGQELGGVKDDVVTSIKDLGADTVDLKNGTKEAIQEKAQQIKDAVKITPPRDLK